MKVKIRLLQEDKLEHTSSVIADTIALWSGDELTYFEDEEHTYKHHVLFLEDRVNIERKGEFSSETSLEQGQIGTSVMHSPYGKMVLNTKLCSYHKQENRIAVEYQILSGENVVSHLQMVWEINGLS